MIAQKASSRESENFKLKDSIPIYLDDEVIIPQVNKEPSIGGSLGLRAEGVPLLSYPIESMVWAATMVSWWVH